jgi:hypothetical protein
LTLITLASLNSLASASLLAALSAPMKLGILPWTGLGGAATPLLSRRSQTALLILSFSA